MTDISDDPLTLRERVEFLRLRNMLAGFETLQRLSALEIERLQRRETDLLNHASDLSKRARAAEARVRELEDRTISELVPHA